MPLLPTSASKVPAKPPPTRIGEKQTIPARHGTATFVPKGHTISIINTYGAQVVDTWAFALGPPPTEDEEERGGEDGNGEKAEDKKTDGKVKQKVNEASGKEEKVVNGEKEANGEVKEAAKEGVGKEKKSAEAGQETEKGEQDPGKGEEGKDEKKDAQKGGSAANKAGWGAYIPSVRGRGKQQPAQKATETAVNAATDAKDDSSGTAKGQTANASEDKNKDAGDKAKEGAPAKPTGWSAYIPSIPTSQKVKKPKKQTEKTAAQKEREKLGWSAYLSSGQGFSSYLPTKGQLSAFTASHERDPTKSYAEQLYDFSKTPVGAAGLSVATGSGYASTLYAAYSAYSSAEAVRAASTPPMEYMSMSHTCASIQRLSPRVGDTLTTNLRAPIVTVTEDTSPGAHGMLIAACDPQWYKELGVARWEEHGSCAENLVFALKQINESAGLKGRRAIGSDVTVYTAPAPLNLFMNIPVSSTDEGSKLEFTAPKSKRGDHVKLRAERDVVIVMSACPQDVLPTNGKKPMVAHFVVESPSEEDRRRADERDSEARLIIDKARARTAAAGQRKGNRTPRKLSVQGTPPGSASNAQAKSEQPAAKTPNKRSSVQAESPPLSAKPSAPSKRPSVQADSPPLSPSPARNGPQQGRGKPKKLERRSTPQSGTPQKAS